MSLALQYYAGHVGSGGRVKDNNRGNGKLFILFIS